MKTKELLENIIKALVVDKEKVTVIESNDERGVLLSVNVSKGDMGKVIGKNGETAKAIRTVIHIAGMTDDARVSVKINEPE